VQTLRILRTNALACAAFEIHLTSERSRWSLDSCGIATACAAEFNAFCRSVAGNLLSDHKSKDSIREPPKTVADFHSALVKADSADARSVRSSSRRSGSAFIKQSVFTLLGIAWSGSLATILFNPCKESSGIRPPMFSTHLPATPEFRFTSRPS
jgi:hypothetical protein